MLWHSFKITVFQKHHRNPHFDYGFNGAIFHLTTQAYTDLNDHPASARLEDATGVNVDYVSPAVGQENTQFNLLTVGGQLPDVVRHTITTQYRGGVDGAVADGLIMDPTALIKHMPPILWNESLLTSKF